MSIYVTYTSRDEVIVSTSDDEHKLLEDYFVNGGRVKEDYDREVVKEPFSITSSVKID